MAAATATVDVKVNVTYDFLRPEQLPQDPEELTLRYNFDAPDDGRFKTKRMTVIPVYVGDTAMESYFRILDTDDEIHEEVRGWATIVTLVGPDDDYITLPLDLSDA
jgi:hypothetical protein